jgi:exodeoxyribonuclease VII large subunit
VPVRADLVYTLSDLDRRQQSGIRRLMRDGQEKLRGLARGLPTLQEILGLRQQRFDELGERLPRALIAGIQRHSPSLGDAAGGLRPMVLRQPLRDGERALREAGRRLEPEIRRRLEDAGGRLAAASRLLESLSYQGVLKRGYAVVRDAGGAAVTAAAGLAPSQALELEFEDGRVDVAVTGSGGGASKSAPRPKKPAGAGEKTAKRKDGKIDKEQGSLF